MHDQHLGHADHDGFGGLHRDLSATGAAMDRRDMVRLALSASALTFLGCSAAAAGAITGSTGTTTTTGTGACAKIPSETEGPYPGDGSNGPNVLSQVGVVRSDIRSSFAGLSGTAAGIPLTINLTITSLANGCTPLAGYAVYIWHCDQAGRYSLYTAGATSQNYLRGVQATNANGLASFTSIFPACYSGRWPHIHFEVYSSLAAATAVSNKLATSQIALPKASCDLVYATSGYAASVTNLSQVSLATDNVFSDGATLELATVTGDVTAGFVSNLSVAV